jgi:hypothetical protein
VRQPAKTIEVCDRCQVGTHCLQTCCVCRKRFCLTCEGSVAGSWGFTRLCRDCARRPDVQEVCAAAAKRLTPIFKDRDATLKKLPTTYQS